MKISHQRWLMAQKKELASWKRTQNIIEDETQEIRIKYSKLLANISGTIAIKKSWSILDVGCGATCISSFFNCSKKYGIDPLADQIGIAGKMIERTLVMKGRGEETPFGNETFDLVICRNVIDHSEDPQKILLETKRVLKMNKYFILACYVYPGFITFVKRAGEISGFRRNIEHPHSYTFNQLESMSKKYFKIVKTYLVFEGKHSTDYGKVGKVKKDSSLLNKFIIFLNKYLFRHKWFVREYLFLLTKTKE